MTTYTILLEGDDDSGWNGIVPDLPGILLAGETRDELLASAPPVIEDYIDAQRERGFPVPEPGRHIATVTVAA
jgi:predicted RNase H-like HicB family nuclease